MDRNSLSHTTWNCKYHIVFAPKYRRQIIYGKIKKDVGKILRKLCDQKGIEILEATACKDHVHLVLAIPKATDKMRLYLLGLNLFSIYFSKSTRISEINTLIKNPLSKGNSITPPIRGFVSSINPKSMNTKIG